MDDANIKDLLQIAGWFLTVVGHIQVTLKRRAGFVTWVLANGVLIALSARVGLWWSMGQYATNTLFCTWSYWRWAGAAEAMRPLFVGRTVR